MKLTIENLKGYQGTGLILRFMHPKVEHQKDGVFQSIHMGSGSYEDIKISIDYDNSEHIWMFKPLLLPLSKLTQEIEHNGKKFVPAQILHRIACEGIITPFNKPQSGWYEGSYDVKMFDDTGCQIITVDTPDDLRESKLEISYDGSTVIFSKNLNNEERDSLIYACHEQMQLFERLYEWHFDIHGLIEKGLAIDKTTLK